MRYVGVASDYLFTQGNSKSGHQCQVMGKRVLEIWAEGRCEMVLRGNQESQRTGEMQWDCSLVWRTPERMKASGVDESTWQWVRTGARSRLRTEPVTRSLLHGGPGLQICEQDYWFREPPGSESRIPHTELITCFFLRIRVGVLPLGLEKYFWCFISPIKTDV